MKHAHTYGSHSDLCDCGKSRPSPAFLIPVAIVFALLFTFVGTGHCTATSAPVRSNAFEAVIFDDNPNIYMYGTVVGGDPVGERNDINVVFQPAHTSLLHTERVLFCRETFNEDKPGHTMPLDFPVVVTYERVAHRATEGVGCHNIVSIDLVGKVK